MVVCHPGNTDVAKSNDTVECTESTSGVEIPASTRYAISIMTPLPVAATPAERKHPVHGFAPPSLRPIPHRRQIRHQPQIPKQNRHSEIGGNREDIPHQRTAKIRPDPVRIWNRRHKPSHPDSADVNSRKNSRTNHGKERHGLGRTINRRTPFLTTKMQNRRDQSSGVTDPDPEDEIGNTPCPANRNIVSPNTDAGEQEIENAKDPEGGERACDRYRDPPPERRFVLDDSSNPIRNPCHRVVIPDTSGRLGIRSTKTVVVASLSAITHYLRWFDFRRAADHVSARHFRPH